MGRGGGAMHVYRWDLDKTYLETDFHSIRGLIRSATEHASDKVTAPGAGAILQALSARPDDRIVILSGSPTQLRPVLEEKLRLDGVRFDRLVLKDNLDNLKRGRMRAIRGQLGYKLPQLLELRLESPRQARETLFGDDAEVDAIVYALYADALAGRLTGRQVAKAMTSGGAYPDEVEAAVGALARTGQVDAVERIFIRLALGSSPERFAPLGGRVVPVHSWLQAALVLHEDGHLAAEDLAAVTENVLQSGTRPDQAAAIVQDIVRRGFVSVDRARAHAWPAPLAALVERSLGRLGPARRARPAGPPEAPVDYPALLHAWTQLS